MRTSATTQAERVAAGPRRRSPAPDDAGASPRPDVSTSPAPGPAPPQGGGTRSTKQFLLYLIPGTCTLLDHSDHS
ncbi:hypothetical protein R6Z07F_009467 [Ovis aries]